MGGDKHVTDTPVSTFKFFFPVTKECPNQCKKMKENERMLGERCH